jgi:hypothetical protein
MGFRKGKKEKKKERNTEKKCTDKTAQSLFPAAF